MNQPRSTSSLASPGLGATAAAWLVHAFTASGAILGFLAMMALMRDAWGEALFWLLVALGVDGIDGFFARLAKVKERAARIDGPTLDLVVDYLNYVFVPTIFLWRAGLVPEGWIVPLMAMIQLSSLYLFTRTDLKSHDNYFRGFPALWNVVAFYLFVTGADPVIGAATVVVFTVLTFAPVHFIHPFRVRDYGRSAPLLATVWVVSTGALLWPSWSEGVRSVWLAASLGSAAILLGMGLLRTMRGPRPAAA